MTPAHPSVGPLAFDEGVWTRDPVSAVVGSGGALHAEA